MRHVPLDIKAVTLNFLQALMFCIKERIKSQGFDEEEKHAGVGGGGNVSVESKATCSSVVTPSNSNI